ncbi:MAG: hypothetical protein M3321_07295 [Actinomycetota bacterium]|nr:hypothetical protein [Actinomycetota bacterium]
MRQSPRRRAQITAPTRILAVVTGLVCAAGVAAAAPNRQTGPDVIYAAFSLLPASDGRLVTRRCGVYTVTSGRYVALSTSPDSRLAGAATFVGRIAVNPNTGLGFTRGTITIRDRRRAVRLRGTVTAVNSNKVTMNGIVAGSVFGPNALLIANVTIQWNENFTFGAVRLGLEEGRNSAVAYTPLGRRCLTALKR